MLQFVTTQEELAAVCDRLLHEPVVALDTEFLWERTYYPILGLVQIAVTGGGCFLLDTVRLDSLQPLGPVLASSGPVKILHDAREDLSILLREMAKSGQCFKPANIFDTRLAAGFAGLSASASLKTLLAKLLDIHLAKTETRSNWIRRPLRDEQIRYAADDVIYLPRLRDALLERCPGARVRRWLSVSNSAMLSTVSPKNSQRHGYSLPVGKKSTMPPRTENCPAPSTCALGVYPASSSASRR